MAMMSLTPTSALSSLEAMLVSLMRGSGGGGSDNTPVDDGPASPPPPPPLPARPTPRGRHPSRYTVVRPAGSWTTAMPLPPSPSKQKDASITTNNESLLAELERKAAEVEAQLQRKEEENAALKRRIESYHVSWLKYEVRMKSLEEACQEQQAALQAVQEEAKARADDETARDRRESLESLMKMSEDPAARRRRHGRDRAAVAGACRRATSAVSRLGGSEFRRHSQALDAALVVVVEPPASRPWQPAVPSANSVDDLRKLKAQFCAWKKYYKARLRRAKAELDKDSRRHRSGVCWI